MANTMTKVAMVEELKTAGIILKNVKKMTKDAVEEKYNEYKNNTQEEETVMTTQNTEAQAINATQSTENTNKEEKNMTNQNAENTQAPATQNTENTATQNTEAEKKAPKLTAEEKERAWADAVNKAVTGHGLTIRYSPKINRTTVLDPSNHSIMCIEHTGRSAVIRSKKDMVPEGYTYTWVECIPINPCMVRFNTIDEFNQGLAKYVAHMDAVFAVRKKKADAEKAAKEAAKKAEAEAKAAAKAEEKAKKEAAKKAAREAKAQAKAEEKARKKAEKEAAKAAKAEAEKAAAETEAKAE